MSRTRVVFSIGAMHGGGSERQMVSLLRNLDRNRFEPHLYLVYRSGPLLDELPADLPISSFEERTAGSGYYLPGLNHRRRVKDMSKFLTEVQADISYDRTFLMTLIAADAAQRCGVANVSTVVTDPSLGFAPVAGRFQTIKRRLLNRLYSRSACVLANSEGAARSAEQFYGLAKQTVGVHYNGLDLDMINQKAQAPIENSWWLAHPGRRLLRIVTAGRLNREKGFHILIDAISALHRHVPDVEFRLAILGEGQAREALTQQIQSRGLSNHIQLIGFQQNAPAWYKSADVFVLPSFLEGMPNVLLESMAVGTSVISTDCPSGPGEILQDGQFGALVPVNSVEGLVAAIQNHVRVDAHNELQLENQRVAAQKRVANCFSIQTATEKLQSIFDSLTTRDKS